MTLASPLPDLFRDSLESWQKLGVLHFRIRYVRGPEVRFVSRQDFEDLIREEPGIYPSVLEVLAAEVRSARLALSGLLGKLGARKARV